MDKTMNEIEWHIVDVIDAPGHSKIIDADGYSITGIICTNTAKKIVAMNNKEIIERNSTNKQKIIWYIEQSKNDKRKYINLTNKIL
jgi:hypothetical protein